MIGLYYVTNIEETLRIPPNRFGEQVEEVLLDLCRQKYENTVAPQTGMIVAVSEVHPLSHGRIIPGDGAVYMDVEFQALTFKPLDGEIVEGEVVEVTKFGVFIRIGCTDALCHVSQLADDYFSFSPGSKGILVGRESGRDLRLGDKVRTKVITASVDHVSMKIAVSMRQKGLGAIRWLEEPNQKTGENGKKKD
ncbi:MAG: DNA-directed RNA polymerase [Candidatus Thorarchaeota archaeon]